MKKGAVALISVVFAASMMLMAFAPVLAKPNQVTVVVKNADGKPAAGVWVVLYAGGTVYIQPWEQTNNRGKALLPVPAGSSPGDGYTVMVFENQGELFLGAGYVNLNHKLSARVVITLST